MQIYNPYESYQHVGQQYEPGNHGLFNIYPTVYDPHFDPSKYSDSIVYPTLGQSPHQGGGNVNTVAPRVSAVSPAIEQSASSEIFGSSGPDRLFGTESADRIYGGGGRDIIRAGGGDDVIVVSDTQFAHIDGGEGTDTLALDGSGIHLDLTRMPSYAVQNVEILDITGTGANTVTVDWQSVRNILYGSWERDLRILGDEDDKVVAKGFEKTGETETVDGVTYDVYANGEYGLWIDEDIGSVEI